MKKTKFNINTNPLLTINQFPDYKAINPNHALPAIEYLVQNNKQKLEEILNSCKESGQATWQFYEQLEIMSDKLSKAWSPISHLHSVNNNDAWRKAYQDCQQIMSLYDAELSQHVGLYNFYLELEKSEEYSNYDSAQKKIISDAIQDFELSGVSLPDEDKQTYQKLMQSASELSMTFANNVLDATQEFKIWIDDSTELSGIPENVLSLYENLANQFSSEYQENINNSDEESSHDELDLESIKTPKYCVTLDFPSYFPLMSYCTNRELREQLYTAYVTRASDCGPNAGEFDNTNVIEAILSVRDDLAKLLGYKDYASLSLVDKMAKTPEKVIDFLNELVDKAKPIAENEFSELKKFAKDSFNIENLEAWDVTFISEQLKQQKYSISEEILREYFPLSKVMNGLFNLTQQLFEVEIVETKKLSTWNPDVKTYVVMENNQEIAYFYLDLYSRTGKSGGAWMNNAIDRIQSSTTNQLPVAYLVCNFMPPTTAGSESYLSHQEINTLFHEFGHGLHHMLSKVKYSAASGINGVEWDAVELPSQFMENFCFQKQVIMDMSKHKESKDQLPEALFDSLIASKNFHSALMMIRQLEFSLFDIEIHDNNIMQQCANVMEVLSKLRNKIAVTPSPAFARFPMSFSHIFAGGYAAGYYSYKWAEVLSADAFAKFEELGIFNKDVGNQFKTEILNKGSSRTASENFFAFRNREPNIEALLRHNGINNSHNQ